jgi:chromosome segregation ATPase
MSDEPENHTLALLREMRAENSARHEQVQAQFMQVQAQFSQMQTQFSQIKNYMDERFEQLYTLTQGQFGQTQAQIKTLAETALDTLRGVRNLAHRDAVVEAELKALRTRVERIEDKLAL